MISVIISHIIMAGCLRPRLAKYWPTISLGLPGLGNTPSTGQYWVILGNMTSDWLSSVKSQWIFTILQFKIQFNKFSKLQKHYYNSDISKFMTPNFDRIKDLWNHEILIHFEMSLWQFIKQNMQYICIAILSTLFCVSDVKRMICVSTLK